MFFAWFPMVCEWFLYCLCMVSACFLHGACMDFAWFLYGFSMVSAWFLVGFCIASAWFWHGFRMVFAWFLDSFRMVSAWFLHGFVWFCISVWFLYAFLIISGFPAYRCRCFLNSSDIQKSEYLSFSYIFSSRNANTIVFAISFTCRKLLQNQNYSTPLSSVE
jgi:hypothetical protein